MLLIIDKEKIGHKRCKITHFNDFFGDGSSSSGNFGVGQATATACSHGNVESFGRSVGSYGDHHQQQQQTQQQHHSLIKPSQQANSNTPPNMLPHRNDVQTYFPSSGPSMSCKVVLLVAGLMRTQQLQQP